MNNNYSPYNTFEHAQDIQTRISMVMKRVYLKMTLALIVSALTALICSNSYAIINFAATHSWVMWVPMIAAFGIVIGISSGINRLSSSAATALFYLFALVMGFMCFPIMLVYSPESLVKTFFITAGVFGAMTVYGYFTSQDLSRWGTFLIMALFGLIIVSIINIFLHSTTMDWIISGAGVLIFIGLTAWDTWQIKQIAMQSPDESTAKLATIGALNLYLDFINLFLYLLRFFGNRD